MPGPLGDYAMVFATTTSQASSGWFWQNSIPDYLDSAFRPARVLSFGAGNFPWEPRDTFAWIEDGLSNTFLVGEKHIPIGRLGKCAHDGGYGTGDNTANQGDCSILSAGDGWYSSYSGRAFVYYEAAALSGHAVGVQENGICMPRDLSEAPEPRNAFNAPMRGYGFGSWHAGVCNFLMGDGSVKAMSVTTPPKMLRYLSVVHDGENVTLP